MKCAQCGVEIHEETSCLKCGRKSDLRKGVEIHYRDFRGSEMLDIRMRSSVPLPGKEIRLVPALRTEEMAGQGSGASVGNGVRRSGCLLAGGLAIILSATGWYYIFKIPAELLE